MNGNDDESQHIETESSKIVEMVDEIGKRWTKFEKERAGEA